VANNYFTNSSNFELIIKFSKLEKEYLKFYFESLEKKIKDLGLT
jgi:hypothetical protein